MKKNGKGFARSYGVPMLIFLFMTSCAPVISKQVRDQVRPETTFSAVFRDPESYKGHMVVFSGVIVSAENTKEGTLFQVLQRPAGFRGRPKDVDTTEGRFLALDSRYLDTYVYAKEREVTVAGEVQGRRTLPLDKTEYTYPLIQVKELYLWPVIEYSDYPPYPYYYYPPYFYYDDYWWWQSHLTNTRKCPKSQKSKK